jgi:hypothetical protein
MRSTLNILFVPSIKSIYDNVGSTVMPGTGLPENLEELTTVVLFPVDDTATSPLDTP